MYRSRGLESCVYVCVRPDAFPFWSVRHSCESTRAAAVSIMLLASCKVLANIVLSSCVGLHIHPWHCEVCDVGCLRGCSVCIHSAMHAIANCSNALLDRGLLRMDTSPPCKLHSPPLLPADVYTVCLYSSNQCTLFCSCVLLQWFCWAVA